MSKNLETSFKKWFEKKYTPESLERELSRIQENIDPRFLSSFESYKEELLALVSEPSNIQVINNPYVQKTIAEENTKIASAFKKASENLQDAYTKAFSNPANNTSYNWWLENVA